MPFKYLVLAAGVGFFMTAVVAVMLEAQRVWTLARTVETPEWPAPQPLPWREAARLVLLGGVTIRQSRLGLRNQ